MCWQYLEELKVKDPEEYKAVMTELQQAARQAQQGFEPVMPGGDKKLGAGGVDSAQQEEGMEISPTPGFVVKTSNSGGTKVFINVCHHEALKEPSKKKQLQADGTEQEVRQHMHDACVCGSHVLVRRVPNDTVRCN